MRPLSATACETIYRRLLLYSPSVANTRLIGGVPVHGVDLGERTECRHYRSELDIVALRFGCCGDYYACHSCHLELAEHPPKPLLQAEFDSPSVLCGACGHQLTVREYMGCGFRCPKCAALFNPGCANHYELYFELSPPPP